VRTNPNQILVIDSWGCEIGFRNSTTKARDSIGRHLRGFLRRRAAEMFAGKAILAWGEKNQVF